MTGSTLQTMILIFKFIQTPISDKNQSGKKFPGKRACALSESRKNGSGAQYVHTHQQTTLIAA
jgi:hypothetical protein